MTKRALLVGSSFSAAPLFFALKKRGLHVTVCGNQKGDPCHQYADASCYIDYSDKDRLLDYVADTAFDFLIPSCNDFSYVSCSWVAHETGFVGYDDWDTTLMLHTKHRFREFCETFAVPAPARQFYKSAGEVAGGLGGWRFPVLVKPVDSFSGRGTTKVLDQDFLEDALQAARDASRTGDVVVEQFLDGSLHSHSAFIQGGSIYWDGFVDEFCTVYPYQVNCSNCPSALPDKVKADVRRVMLEVVSRAKLSDGLLHTQFIVLGSQFWIIECMRRCPGDLYGRLIEQATGLNYTNMYVAKFLGEPYPEPPRQRPATRFVGRHTVSVAAPTVSAGLGFNIACKNLSFVPLKTSAEKLGVAPFDKLGIMFVEFDTAAAMSAAVPHFVDAIAIDSLEKMYG